MRKLIIILVVVCFYGCKLNKNLILIGDNSVTDSFENNVNYIYDDIEDPVDVYIYCGEKSGEKNAKLVIENPNIKKVLKGFAIITIYFADIDSLKIEKLEFDGLVLKDTVTNKIVLKCFKTDKNTKYEKNEIYFYESKLIPIITHYKCWIEDDNIENKIENRDKKIFSRVFYFQFLVEPEKTLH